MNWRQTRAPGTLMAMAAILCIVGAASTVLVAIDTPWLGLRLAPDSQGARIIDVAEAGPARGLDPGDYLIAVAGLPVSAEDIVEEPDTLDSYARRDAFYERQGRFIDRINAPSVRLDMQGSDGAARSVVVRPKPGRPLGSLPWVFWVQIISGSASFLIAAWVWVLKPREAATRLLALSGLALMLSANAAAIYSTRELALTTRLFETLSLFNVIGTMMFGPSLVTLFLCYPKPLVSRRALLTIFAILSVTPFLIIAEGSLPPVYALYGAVAIDMVLIVSLIAWQWRRSRTDLHSRAALRWLGLLVGFGVGAFTFSTAAPLLLGFKAALSQGYSFLFFVLIYIGLALGLRRYRLFELNTWAFRVLFLMGAALAFLIFDAVLIWALHLGERSALGLALAAVIFLYLPLRDWLWRRTVGRRDLNERDLVDGVTKAALGATAGERAERWEGLMRQLFDPLEIERVETSLTQPQVALEGLEMILPATSDSPALKLRYPWAGRALFAPPHLSLARQAYALLGRLEVGRDAYVQGAMAERKRIARDLHDDVGARLLTGLHEAGPETRPLLSAALADVRAIVGGLTGERRPLAHVLADLRYETARRLDAVDVALHWPVTDAEEEADLLLDYDLYKNLSSAFREVITNLIRHAEASIARVSVQHGETLVIDVTDDGKGLSELSERRTGHGLRNMAERLEAIGGAISFPPTEYGTCVRLTLRLAVPSGSGMPAPSQASKS